MIETSRKRVSEAKLTSPGSRALVAQRSERIWPWRSLALRSLPPASRHRPPTLTTGEWFEGKQPARGGDGLSVGLIYIKTLLSSMLWPDIRSLERGCKNRI